MVPHPWRRSRLGWMGPWAAQSRGWQTCLQQGVETEWSLRSLLIQAILCFYDSMILFHIKINFERRYLPSCPIHQSPPQCPCCFSGLWVFPVLVLHYLPPDKFPIQFQTDVEVVENSFGLFTNSVRFGEGCSLRLSLLKTAVCKINDTFNPSLHKDCRWLSTACSTTALHLFFC